MHIPTTIRSLVDPLKQGHQEPTPTSESLGEKLAGIEMALNVGSALSPIW